MVLAVGTSEEVKACPEVVIREVPFGPVTKVPDTGLASLVRLRRVPTAPGGMMLAEDCIFTLLWRVSSWDNEEFTHFFTVSIRS